MTFNNFVIAIALLTSTLNNSHLKNTMTDIIENIEVVDIHGGIIYENISDENHIPLREIIKFNENGLLLSEGIVSEEVFKLRRFLMGIGYSDLGDGYFYDSKLKDAIVNYQLSKGLAADGIVGKETYSKINEDLELYNIILPELKLNFNMEVPEGRWLIINKTNNTLYHLFGKDVIKKYPVATGKYLGLTPEGKFRIVNKLRDPAWGGAGKYTPVRGGAPNNPLGRRWMGLSVGGGGEYGIHGNSDPRSIGRFVSLGCIRMFNEDVEFIFEIVELGTPVWIGREDKLQEFGITIGIE